jgi:chorismate mutase
MNLSEIRNHLDRIDNALVLLLAERLAFIPYVAEYKLKHNIERYQPEREKEILMKKSELGKKHNLREEYMIDIFKRIIEESHHIEKDIMGK